MVIAPENQWDAHGFHIAIDYSAHELLKGLDVAPEQHEAARQRVLAHWLNQVAPAGVA